MALTYADGLQQQTNKKSREKVERRKKIQIEKIKILQKSREEKVID